MKKFQLCRHFEFLNTKHQYISVSLVFNICISSVICKKLKKIFFFWRAQAKQDLNEMKKKKNVKII